MDFPALLRLGPKLLVDGMAQIITASPDLVSVIFRSVSTGNYCHFVYF